MAAFDRRSRPGISRFFVSVRPLLLALGFLTRLAPPLQASTQEMAAAVRYYPFAGGILGAVLCLPFALGAFSSHPWVQAWLFVMFSAWLTRALHLDGLADVLDALGSGRHGDEFRAILKDSRIGAFGVAGLALALCGSIILAAALFTSNHLAPLFFAPLYGRCLPIIFACMTPAHPQAGLGALLAASSRLPALILAAGSALLAGLVCLPPLALLICCCTTALCLFPLSRLATREGGYNGDFFGCAIILGELSVLLAALV